MVPVFLLHASSRALASVFILLLSGDSLYVLMDGFGKEEKEKNSLRLISRISFPSLQWSPIIKSEAAAIPSRTEVSSSPYCQFGPIQ